MRSIAILSAFLVATFTFAADAPPQKDGPVRVVMFSGSAEYKSTESLQAFKAVLEAKHNCLCTVHVVEEKGTRLNGIEDLETADVAVLFTRRVSLAPDQLERVKKFVSSGKGVVGVRTASHGFQTWLGFDAEVLGGSYNNHYGKDLPADVTVEEKGKDHPVLAGVKAFNTTGKLYKNPKVAEDATVLLRAKTAEYAEPVAWAREAKAGVRGRVFYTSLGVPKDFEDGEFQRMLANAVRWAGKRD